MREVTTHKGDLLNDALKIEAGGEVSAGGSETVYYVFGAYPASEQTPDSNEYPKVAVTLRFHTGDPRHGVKGISNESLLAIVEDRLAGFQAGPFACPENDSALASVRCALGYLHSRTTVRRARGVEGKATP